MAIFCHIIYVHFSPRTRVSTPSGHRGMRTWRLRQPYGSIGLQERLVGGSGRPSGAFWAVRAGVTCEEPQTRKSVHQVKNTFFAQIAGNGPDSVLDWSQGRIGTISGQNTSFKTGPPL